MKAEKNSQKGKTVSFKYIFPTDTRELHVGGAFGGLAPDGTIRMAVYSERQAIPNVEKRLVKPDKTLGDQIGEEKKYEFVRIVQASLVFNAETARSFINWLGDRIKESEQFKEEASNSQGKKEKNNGIIVLYVRGGGPYLSMDYSTQGTSNSWRGF